MKPPPRDLHLFCEDNILEQLKSAPFTLGFYTLKFYSIGGRPVNKVTQTIADFFLYPSGGTLRDSKSNIVMYSSRFDTYRGFKHRYQKEAK
jgi:hypothetical protein